MQQKILDRRQRAQRTTTSCTECQRRKQKCNQGQPCSNCFGRNPQRTCEYKHNNPNGRQKTQGIPNVVVFSAANERRASSSPTEPNKITSKSTPKGYAIKLEPQSTDDAHQWKVFSWLSTPSKGTKTNSQYRHKPGNPSTQSYSGEEQALEREQINSEHLTKANLWQLGGPLTEILTLPMQPTRENAMLLQTFIQHLYRFKGSLDGRADPDNPFIHSYVPLLLSSPLLCSVSLSVAAASLVELGRVPPAMAVALKGRAIAALNTHLRHSQDPVGDEAVSAVSQLIFNDWYYGDTRDSRAHLRGLRDMVRLRGGFGSLGCKGLIARSAVITDCFVAITMESPPLFQYGIADVGSEFHLDMREPPPAELNLSYNSPLLASFPHFAECPSLDLHAATAGILDDIRFLFSAVLKLPSGDSGAAGEGMDRVRHTAKWVQHRIQTLPEVCPDGLHHSGSLSPTVNDYRAAPGSDNADQRASLTTLDTGSDPDAAASRHEPPSSADSPSSATPDFLYATVRQASLIWSRAILHRQPLSAACGRTGFLSVWTTAWRVPLARWTSVLGVFVWCVAALAPSAGELPMFATFVKSMLHIGSVQMSLGHWEACREMLHTVLRVQAWLRGGQRAEEARSGASDGDK